MFETAVFFLVAFVLVVLSLDMLVVNIHRLTVVAALWMAILALYAFLWGVKFYVAQVGHITLLGWIQRLQDAVWVHQGWVAWLLTYTMTREQQEFPWRVLVLVGMSMVFSGWSLVGGLYDSLYFYSQVNIGQAVTGVMVVPSVGRFLAMLYTGFLLGLAALELLRKYSLLPYAFQQRRIRYLATGGLAAGIMFLLAGDRVIGYGLKALAMMSLGVVIFYVSNTFRALKIREKMIRFLSVVLFGFLLMTIPAGVFYVFRQWLMTLSPEIFVLIFSLGMAMYFLMAVLLLTVVRKEFLEREMDEEFFPLLVKRLGQTRNREDFYEALALFFKNFLEREVDIVERHGQDFEVRYSTRGYTGRVAISPILVRHLESGEGYFDRELVLHQRAFRRDAGLFFQYFDRHHCEAVLALLREGHLDLLIQFVLAPRNEEEGFSHREVKRLRMILRLIEVLYQNVLFLEKEEQNEQTQRELMLASEIQETIFQRDVPRVHGLDIAFYQEPAKWLSGDYLWLDGVSSHELGFVVADVSGKGVSAALITMMLHSMVQSYTFGSSTISALLQRLNEMLSRKKSRQEWRTLSFATVFAGFIDTDIQTVFFSNAGHYPLLVWDREKREFSEISTAGKPVGLFAETSYVTETYRYESDQILVLYSDGITECLNTRQEEFGLHRLKSLIQRYDERSAEGLRDKILESLREFSSGMDIYDDMTLLIIKT